MTTLETSNISKYFSLVRISHTIFSLPFALIGFFLAFKFVGGNFPIRSLFLVLLSVFFARNAAMGFNRYADREFDKKNPRTALREIPRAIIKPKSAMLFVILNAGLFILCTYFLNLLCLFLSPLALLVVLGYSLTKRFTALSHVFLGLGLSLAPIGAYLAITARFDLLPLLFSFMVIFWVAGFDILYALLDIEFDKSENLKSLPVFLGKRNALVLSGIFHSITLILVVVAGWLGQFHLIYWIGAILFALLLLYEHVIVKPSDISRVNLTFTTLNGAASVLYACFVIADLLLY
ncbi:MAG: putative 4-hydroxybenzoate polyprenyltransferase [Bacteroidales bacterium]|nr:putative 4-hydroxybenzoate polyprenyltransferase [Bacteroidales bacterium]MDD4604525.1 putative 4-hydroxybenzoate polyprenyltransferase [Bacteroidales bacterium]